MLRVSSHLCSQGSCEAGTEDTVEALPGAVRSPKIPPGSTAWIHASQGRGRCPSPSHLSPAFLLWMPGGACPWHLSCSLGAASQSPPLTAPAVSPLSPATHPSSIPPVTHPIPPFSGVHPLHAPPKLRPSSSSPQKQLLVVVVARGSLSAAVSPALFSRRFYSHSHSHQISHGPEAPRLQGLH